MMAKAPWKASRSGSEKRPWAVTRTGEIARNARGLSRTFATAKAAERASEKLNDDEGIFVSGFDGVADKDRAAIHDRFLAGDTVSEVRGRFRDRDGKLRFSVSSVRRMRDEVFAPLVGNPDAIKALADGPLLNPTNIVRYKHSREEVAAGIAKQQDMFA